MKGKWTETIIWGSILFALVFPRAGTKIGGVPVTVGSVLLGVLFIFWLLEQKRKRAYKNLLPAGHYIFLIYSSLMLAAIVLFKLDHPMLARIKIVIPLFVPLIIYYAAYPLAADWLALPDRAGKFLRILVYANIGIGIYGLMQYFLGHYRVLVPGLTMSWTDAHIPHVFETKSNLMWDGEALKVTSTFQNGNIFGVYLAMTNPIILSAYLTAANMKDKITAGLSTLLSAANVPITLARSAFFGSSVTLFILFLMRPKLKNKMQIAIVYLFMVAMIFSKKRLFERMILSFFDPSLGGRAEGIKKLSLDLEGARDVLFGLLFKGKPFVGDSFFQRASENIYVTLFYWLGLLGVLLFLYTYRHSIWKLFLTLLRTKNVDNPLIGFGHGLVAGMGGYLVMAIIEGAFYLPPTGINFWLFLGASAAINNIVICSNVNQAYIPGKKG